MRASHTPSCVLIKIVSSRTIQQQNPNCSCVCSCRRMLHSRRPAVCSARIPRVVAPHHSATPLLLPLLLLLRILMRALIRGLACSGKAATNSTLLHRLLRLLLRLLLLLAWMPVTSDRRKCGDRIHALSNRRSSSTQLMDSTLRQASFSSPRNSSLLVVEGFSNSRSRLSMQLPPLPRRLQRLLLRMLC